MRLYLLPTILIFSSIHLHAQKGLPAFGKIDKADLEITDCEFDKGAEAYKLLDWGSVYYDRGTNLFKLVTERRVRIKILKEKGLAYANVTIPFYSKNNNERISHLDACTYNLDAAGNIVRTDADKKSIYTQRVNNNHSEVIIAFPAVKTGSIIEYKYQIESEYITYIDDWYFQDEIPTRLSRYEIKAPLLFVFKEDQFIYMNAEKKTDETEEFMTVNNGDLLKIKVLKKSFVLQNVPGIHDEPFMSSKKDYMQRISFQLSQIDYGNGRVDDKSTSWRDVQKRLMEDEDFGTELTKQVPGTQALQEATAKCSDSLCKMVAVYNYVRNNMSWNNIRTIYSPQGVRAAWEKKNGTLGDINIILVNLLKQNGVNAVPILVSTKDNGAVNIFYPSEKQFDAVMAYVEIGNRYYLLNAADRYNPYSLIPYNVNNTRGFILDEEMGRWIVVSSPLQKYKQFAAIHASIDAAGNMKGEATVNSYDYAKSSRSKRWMEDKGGFKENYFIKSYRNMKVDELEVNNAGNDTLPLEQKIKFNTALNSSGNYKYFNVNLFSGLESNPFVADERQTDIDFDYGQEYILYGNFTIPEDYSFEELPKNVSMIMPDTSIVFSRFMSAEDNALSVRISVEFRQSLYSADNYDYFKEFYKKLFDKLNEQIVIKKKTAVP